MVNQLSEFARLMEQTGRNLQLVLDVAGGRTEDLQRSLPPPSLQAGEAPALKQLDAASFEASVSLDVLATGLGVRPVAGTGAGIDAPANAPGTLPQREEYFELLERFREWCVDRRKVFVLEARAALCAHMGESPTLPPPPSDKRVEAARKTRSRSNEPADAAPGKDAGVPASGSIASDGGAGEKVRGGRIRCVETGKVYDSVKAAKQEIGPKDIGRALSVPGATAGGLHWERVLDDGNPPPREAYASASNFAASSGGDPGG